MTGTVIGLGASIQDVAEFNRRALIALRAVKHTSSFITNMIRRLDAGVPLTWREQQALYNTVHGYRRQITDKLLTDYASARAKGYS